MFATLPNAISRKFKWISHLSYLVYLIAALVLTTLGAAQPANAQRRVRLTVGGTTTQETWSGYDTGLFGGLNYNSDSSIAFVMGVAYDAAAITTHSPDNPLIFGPYLDIFNYFALFSQHDPNCVGLGVTIRTQQSFFYYGAGVGIYREDWHGGVQGTNVFLPGGTPTLTTLGGKLFAGLQGQSSLFLEFSVTSVGSGGFQPGGTILLGLRL